MWVCLSVCVCVSVCNCLHWKFLTAGCCAFISHFTSEAIKAWSFTCMEWHCWKWAVLDIQEKSIVKWRINYSEKGFCFIILHFVVYCFDEFVCLLVLILPILFSYLNQWKIIYDNQINIILIITLAYKFNFELHGIVLCVTVLHLYNVLGCNYIVDCTCNILSL